MTRGAYSSIVDISEQNSYLIPNDEVRGIGAPYVRAGSFFDASKPFDPTVLAGAGIQLAAIPSPISNKWIHLPDGTVSAPGLAFVGETNSGRYRIGANNIGESINSTLVFDWNATQIEYASGYKLRIGTSASIYAASSETVSILETQNNASGIIIKNASTGTAAFASIGCLNSLDNDFTAGISSTGLTGQLGGVMTIGAGDAFCGMGKYSMSGSPTGGDFWVYNLFSTKSIVFATNAARRMTLLASGCLGINRTAAFASELLSVGGGIVSTTLTATGVVYAGTNGLLSTDHTHFSYDATNFRVGINNTAPNRALDVVSNTTTTAAARFGRNTSNNGMYVLSFADSQMCVAGGAEFVTSNWIARAAQATIVLTTGDGVTGGDLWVMNGTSLSAGSSFTPTTRIYMSNTGLVGIGTGAAAGMRLESLDASAAQLRLSHTASSVVTDFRTLSTGFLTITPTNGGATIVANNATTATPILDLTQASTGDAAIRWALGSSRSYVLGIDNSVSGDPLVLATVNSGSAALGSGNLWSITSVGYSTWSVSDTATTPFHDLIQSSTGDASIRYAIGTTNSYIEGIDNSDSDKWKVSWAGSGSAALGTNDYLTLTVAGLFNVVQYMNVGTATDAAAQGDFAAGLSAGRRLFWDESLARMTMFGSQNPNLVYDPGSNVAITVDFDVATTVTSQAASIRWHRSTATSGGVRFQFFKGDGTNTLQHTIGGNEDSGLCLEAARSIGIGTSGPDRKLEVFATSPQLRLSYTEGSVYTDFETDSSGNLTINVTGTKVLISDALEIDGALDHDGTTVGFYGVTPVVRSSAYTPTNVTTDRAYDANATTTDELADVLGTLIADLQATGIIA